MSNYSKTTNFALKDSLLTGDPDKVIKGAEIDTEFTNIATAITSKQDALTGLTSSVSELNILDGVTATTAEINRLDGILSAAVGISDTQTLTNKTLTAVVIDGGYAEEVYTSTPSTTFAVDPANGSVQDITLGASISFTDSLSSGEAVLLKIDDGSAYTITWPTMTWVNGSAPTLDTTNPTFIAIWKIGSNLFGTYVGVTS